MREIKFRAWEKPNEEYDFHGEMLFSSMVDNKRGIELVSFYHDSGWEWEDFEFMEFTGLKDIKGNDVYEGDIIESLDWNPSRYQVGFNRGGFCFFNEGDMFYNDIKYVESNFTVIGNIHENPELLSK